MELTEQERAALERIRSDRSNLTTPRGPQFVWCDIESCVNAMLDRLYPIRTYDNIVIRWDDEITPERLVACGFVFVDREDSGNKYFQRHAMVKGIHSTYITVRAFSRFTGSSEIEIVSGSLRYEIDGQCVSIPHEYQPSNMLDIWNLMARCGIKESGE